jgi:hypothetical protein
MGSRKTLLRGSGKCKWQRFLPVWQALWPNIVAGTVATKRRLRWGYPPSRGRRGRR